jgi:hypothetical protein
MYCRVSLSLSLSAVRAWWPYGADMLAAMAFGLLHGVRTLAATLELKRQREEHQD